MIEFPLLPGGFEDGEENRKGKEGKKGNLGKIKLLAEPNHKTKLVKYNVTLFKP